MKKNIFIGALIVTVAILLYWMLRDPKTTDSHKDEHQDIRDSNKVLVQKYGEYLHFADSVQKDARRRDSVEVRLKQENVYLRRVGDEKAATVLRLTKEKKTLPDTTRYHALCDSLAIEAENLAYLYNQYRENNDSLVASLDSTKASYAAALAEQNKLCERTRAQYFEVYNAYMKLFDDYSKSQRSLKRERLKTKVAALLALVGGAAAVIK